MGWHTLLDLQENPDTKRLEITRDVLPGTYNFKFIVDGRWVANHDYPTYLVRALHLCCDGSWALYINTLALHTLHSVHLRFLRQTAKTGRRTCNSAMQLHHVSWNCTEAAVRQQLVLSFVLCGDKLHVQDGNNINNTMTVLPRDANDSGVRERLLSPKGMWLRCSSVALSACG